MQTKILQSAMFPLNEKRGGEYQLLEVKKVR